MRACSLFKKYQLSVFNTLQVDALCYNTITPFQPLPQVVIYYIKKRVQLRAQRCE